MLLTIATNYQPATDLGYLLHKHPGRVQSFDLSFGKAHVFYPAANDALCIAGLLLDVDAVGMVRGRRGSSGDGALDQYVNDRPYVASSFLSVAIAQVFGSALGGRCKERPELVARAIPLEACLAVVPSRGGERLLRQLFEPLGYHVETERHALDSHIASWGGLNQADEWEHSPYYTLTLRAERPLSELLTHLYVLIPVLDDEKHYWVGQEEVEKLLRFGGDWLAAHPERELIARRYLRRQQSLTRQALARLIIEEAESATDQAEPVEALEEERISLHEQRIGAVLSALEGAGAKSILDLGCGEGKLLRALMKRKEVERIVGLDVSIRSLERAAARLRLDRMPQNQRDRIELIHGSLMYRDARLSGFDAAAVVEVIEHLDAPRLAAFERVLFEFARPRTVLLTTPNVEYNVRFEGLPEGKLRHPDHRFEWTRTEFEAWATQVTKRHGYSVRFIPIGPVDDEVGSPTQMGVFDATPQASFV